MKHKFSKVTSFLKFADVWWRSCTRGTINTDFSLRFYGTFTHTNSCTYVTRARCPTHWLFYTPFSGSFMSHPSAIPNFQKCLSSRSPWTSISFARLMTFKTEPLRIIQTSEHRVAFFTNNDRPTLQPQCPSLHAQERMLLLPQWKDCSACLTSHWVQSCDANRPHITPHITPLGMKQLLASFEALPLTDPMILWVNSHWFLSRNLTTMIPLLHDERSMGTGIHFPSLCHTHGHARPT